MDSQTLGEHYSRIAEWWDNGIKDSKYGVEYVERAIQRVQNKGSALDVGCGSGGRIINSILSAGFSLTALDVSEGMIRLAQKKHRDVHFIHTDLLSWKSAERFDLIIAWDSIFHAPCAQQKPIIEKLCGLLSPDGVLLFTGSHTHGDIIGEDMNGVGFEYGSLHYLEYLRIMEQCGCEFIIMERDQPDPRHVVYMCRKLADKDADAV
ncbi:methyltransferase domain-containing protein [Pontiellaceae bacterium B12227]|nr:methyltransferase domain-containing protein [Pontiellaceae bacterium B12227]